jgi:transcriptional regulator with XRE-family HTH domain
MRLEQGIRLLDMAKRLNISAAFLSAIETGRKKSIPASLVTNIAVEFSLDKAAIEKLRRAEDKTKKEVRLDALSSENRELVAAFARKVDELPADLIDALKKKVFKSMSGETPFHRMRKGIIVPARSTESLWSAADQVRDLFVERDEPEFPIMDVLEFRLEQFIPGFYVDVRTAEEMDGDEGRVVAGVNGIALREDVYEGAWNRVGRDRFTACHEFGHFLMHRQVTMARATTDKDKIYCDSEWQADTFAGALLLSRHHAPQFDGDAQRAASACGITPAAANVMLTKYEKARAPA